MDVSTAKRALLLLMLRPFCSCRLLACLRAVVNGRLLAACLLSWLLLLLVVVVACLLLRNAAFFVIMFLLWLVMMVATFRPSSADVDHGHTTRTRLWPALSTCRRGQGVYSIRQTYYTMLMSLLLLFPTCSQSAGAK